MGYSPQGRKELDTTEVTYQARTHSLLWEIHNTVGIVKTLKHLTGKIPTESCVTQLFQPYLPLETLPLPPVPTLIFSCRT